MKYWAINIRDNKIRWSRQYPNHPGIDEHIKCLEKEKYDAIILFGNLEDGWDIDEYYDINKIYNASIKQNIKIYHIVGSNLTDYRFINDNIETIRWPTYFFKETIGNNVLNSNKIIFDLNELEYEHHFIFLNNKSRYHRIRLLDYITEFDLLKFSAYSWHDLTTVDASNALREDFYKFNHYDGSIKILDTQFEFKGPRSPLNKTRTNIGSGNAANPQEYRNQYLVPKEYYQSFFQLIPESTTKNIFITEKTVIPLLIGKPFLVAGAPNYHKLLKDLGFELYDELFDYSFDGIENITERFTGICENIKNITNLSLDECREFHSKIQDKITHNRNRAIEIAYDRNYVPELVKNILDGYAGDPKEIDIRMARTDIDLQKTKDEQLKYIKR